MSDAAGGWGISMLLTPIGRPFYARRTLPVAREVLGKLLVRRLAEGVLVGKIVEAEAYGGPDDPASHAYRGRTERNEAMFGEPGRAYIYFIYGNHYCLNVVTESVGVPAAVLIRALEPVEGLTVMRRNRGVSDALSLTNGPGRLTEALGITRDLNGCDLTDSSSPLYIADRFREGGFNVVQTGRVGVRAAADRPWRFYLGGSPYVSKK